MIVEKKASAAKVRYGCLKGGAPFFANCQFWIKSRLAWSNGRLCCFRPDDGTVCWFEDDDLVEPHPQAKLTY